MNTSRQLNLVSRDSKKFNQDPRRKQEFIMRPAIDRIYLETFGFCIPIRHDDDHKTVLDIEHSIDVTLQFGNGSILTAQEKALSHEFMLVNSGPNLTVEYYQDPRGLKWGDWWHGAAQLYFCGYANEDLTRFVSYVIVDWPRMVLETNRHNVKWHDTENKNGVAKSSFRYVHFHDIPGHCIVAIDMPES